MTLKGILAKLRGAFTAAEPVVVADAEAVAVKAKGVPYYVWGFAVAFLFGGCCCNHLHKAHPRLFAPPLESVEPPLAEPPEPAPPDDRPALWHPDAEGSGDLGLWLGDRLLGRFQAATGDYLPWAGDRYGAPVKLVPPRIRTPPAYPPAPAGAVLYDCRGGRCVRLP